MQICKKLQQLRKDANMSQYELADKIFVTRDLISKWETGERRPSYDNLIKLSEVLSCDIEELMETNNLLEDELASCFPNGFIEKEQNIEEILSSFLRTLPERDCNVFIRRYYFFDDSNQIGKYIVFSTTNSLLAVPGRCHSSDFLSDPLPKSSTAVVTGKAL